MRHSLLRLTQLFLLALLLTLGGLLWPGEVYVHGSEWDPNVSLGVSDYRPATAWGSPFHFILDHPYKEGVGRINAADHFYAESLVLDFYLWFMAVGLVYLFGLFMVWIYETASSRNVLSQ